MTDEARRRRIIDSGCHAPPQCETAPSLPRPRIIPREGSALEIRATKDGLRDAISAATRAAREYDRVTVYDDETGRVRFHIIRPSKPLDA